MLLKGRKLSGTLVTWNFRYASGHTFLKDSIKIPDSYADLPILVLFDSSDVTTIVHERKIANVINLVCDDIGIRIEAELVDDEIDQSMLRSLKKLYTEVGGLYSFAPSTYSKDKVVIDDLGVISYFVLDAIFVLQSPDGDN